MAENNGGRSIDERLDSLEISVSNLREIVGELYADGKQLHDTVVEMKLAMEEVRRSSESQRDSIRMLAVYADRLLKSAIDHEQRITNLENPPA